MSELRGVAKCPSCSRDLWKVTDWTAYLSLRCVCCLYKLGEVTRTGQ